MERTRRPLTAGEEIANSVKSGADAGAALSIASVTAIWRLTTE